MTDHDHNDCDGINDALMVALILDSHTHRRGPDGGGWFIVCLVFALAVVAWFVLGGGA